MEGSGEVCSDADKNVMPSVHKGTIHFYFFHLLSRLSLSFTVGGLIFMLFKINAKGIPVLSELITSDQLIRMNALHFFISLNNFSPI